MVHSLRGSNANEKWMTHLKMDSIHFPFHQFACRFLALLINSKNKCILLPTMLLQLRSTEFIRCNSKGKYICLTSHGRITLETSSQGSPNPVLNGRRPGLKGFFWGLFLYLARQKQANHNQRRRENTKAPTTNLRVHQKQMSNISRTSLHLLPTSMQKYDYMPN